VIVQKSAEVSGLVISGLAKAKISGLSLSGLTQKVSGLNTKKKICSTVFQAGVLFNK
jgi:hypothetical protein